MALPRTRMLFPLLTAGLLAAAPARAELGPKPGDWSLGYAVYVGGVHVLDATAHVGLGSSDYRIGLAAATEGFLGRVASWKADVASHGVLEPGAAGPLRPNLFRSHGAWQDKPRNTVVEYTADGLPKVTVADPPPEKDREPVPENLRPNTVDPMSAVVVVLQAVAQGQGCKATVPVYDGRQRYDLSFTPKGTEDIAKSDLSVFAGPAQACGLDFKPVAGRWKEDRARRDRDEEGRRRNPRDVTLWVAPAQADRPPLPVRLESDSPLGKVVVHLSRLERVGGEKRAEAR